MRRRRQPAQLRPQEAILFDEIGGCLPFLVIQPSDDGAKQQMQRHDVDPERESNHRPDEAFGGPSIQPWDNTGSVLVVYSSG